MTIRKLDRDADQVIEHEAGHVAAGVITPGGYVESVIVHAATTPDAEQALTSVYGSPTYRAVVTLAGIVETDELPTWSALDDRLGDDKVVMKAIGQLGGGEQTFNRLMTETVELVASAPYRQLQPVLADALREHGQLSREDVERIAHEIEQGAGVDHPEIKAATATVELVSDAGTFSAVVSTAKPDREKDIVEPEAMAGALRSWSRTTKQIPLVWHHGIDNPANIVGSVDPTSAKVVGDEVVIEGHVDQSTPRGREVWRLVKANVLGLSFGYRITGGAPRAGGGRHISALDVYEVTLTAVPMNPGTRVTAYKATPTAADAEQSPTLSTDWARAVHAFLVSDSETESVAAFKAMNLALGIKAARQPKPKKRHFERIRPEALARLRPLLEHYSKTANPYQQCVLDNTAKFGPGRVEKVCGVFVDILESGTAWRSGAPGALKPKPKKSAEPLTYDSLITWLDELPGEDIDALVELLNGDELLPMGNGAPATREEADQLVAELLAEA